jgi:hypothetical protein
MGNSRTWSDRKGKVLGELAPRAGQEREKILAGYPRALNLLTATPTLYDKTINWGAQALSLEDGT